MEYFNPKKIKHIIDATYEQQESFGIDGMSAIDKLAHINDDLKKDVIEKFRKDTNKEHAEQLMIELKALSKIGENIKLAKQFMRYGAKRRTYTGLEKFSQYIYEAVADTKFAFKVDGTLTKKSSIQVQNQIEDLRVNMNKWDENHFFGATVYSNDNECWVEITNTCYVRLKVAGKDSAYLKFKHVAREKYFIYSERYDGGKLLIKPEMPKPYTDINAVQMMNDYYEAEAIDKQLEELRKKQRELRRLL